MLAQKDLFFGCLHQSEVFNQNKYKHISITYMLLLMSAIYIWYGHCVLCVFARVTGGQSLPKETTTFADGWLAVRLRALLKKFDRHGNLIVKQKFMFVKGKTKFQ